MSTDKETSGVQQFGTSCFTPDEYAYLQHVLAKQLGPEWVKQRPGPAGAGTMVYVEGHTIINLANKLFGFNGWSSEIKSMTTDYIDVLENGRMNICISVVMRVTLKDGTFHEDIGVGSMENCKSKAIGIQKAKKEAVTDATKRAIRYFGSVLGNCIHDKVYMRDIMRLPTPIRRLDANQLFRDTPATLIPVPTNAATTTTTTAPTTLNSSITPTTSNYNNTPNHSHQYNHQKIPTTNAAAPNQSNGHASGHKAAQTTSKPQPETIAEVNETKPPWQEDSFIGYEDDNSFLEQLAEADFDYADGEPIFEDTDGMTSGVPQKRVRVAD